MFVAKFPISPSSQLIRQDFADLVIHYNNPIFLSVSLGSSSLKSANKTSAELFIAVQCLIYLSSDKSFDKVC